MKRARPGQTESLGKFQWRHFDLFSLSHFGGHTERSKKNIKNAKFASLGLAGVREGTKKKNLINIEKKTSFETFKKALTKNCLTKTHTFTHVRRLRD